MAAEPELTPEDREAIRVVLTNWKDYGMESPLVPFDVDVDGDGIVDAWGLDENGEVVLVRSSLEQTVFRSDGDGLVEGR